MLGIIFAAHFGNFILLLVGAVLVLGTMFFWWRDVVKESRTPGLHTPVVRLGLRYGMMLLHLQRGDVLRRLLLGLLQLRAVPRHPGQRPDWCGRRRTIHTFDPFHLPFLNTMILLLSGTTITWAHHCLLERDRKGMV